VSIRRDSSTVDKRERIGRRHAIVLLVQPDDDSRQMYAEFLRHHGCLTMLVSDAARAQTMARDVDVVVTGILLNGTTDGLELVARLRGDERTKRLPIIVLTACAWQTERDRAEQVGCDVFLPKPCLPDDLLKEIRLLLATAKLRHVRRERPAKVENTTKRGGRHRKRSA
jgi:two-component system, cell cycle response regulator DivK